jgi:hypothetical protein
MAVTKVYFGRRNGSRLTQSTYALFIAILISLLIALLYRSYNEHTVPLIVSIIYDHPELLFQQDNSSSHASKGVLAVLAESAIWPIFWPANSPDLSPIESLWNDMKNYIQDRYPEVHRSYKKLRIVVLEAWKSITTERVRELVHTMPERCIDVIVANGGPTKW